MKHRLLTILLCGLFLCMSSLAYITVSRAGDAGVGVINVPPKYGYIRVEQQDDLIRVYLTISDYNSWGDISLVNITIDNNDVPIASFLFMQYPDNESYYELNEFSEVPSTSHLLQKEKCLFEKSNATDTVDDRCDLQVRFVFKETMFSGLKVAIYDRDGSDPAEAYLRYSVGDVIRTDNVIVIPFVGSIVVPPFLTDLFALVIASAGTLYYLTKKGYLKRKKTPL
jgi:hypothetical protein